MSGYARRRLVAVLVAAAAIAIIWLALFRTGGDTDEGSAHTGRGVSESVAGLVRGLGQEEEVDQVLLLGFDGTDVNAPILAQVRDRGLGGVLVGERNWQLAEQ
jgi:hypothetical protein